MSVLYQKAEEQFKNRLPFVLYSKPGETVAVGIFQKDASLHFTTDFKEEGFVFALFRVSNLCCYQKRNRMSLRKHIPESQLKITIQFLEQMLQPKKTLNSWFRME
jgi:hypothetical protein